MGRGSQTKRSAARKTDCGVREEIACGVSIGIKESLDELTAAVKKELGDGYQRIKIKIKPGYDLEPVRACGRSFADQADGRCQTRLTRWRIAAPQTA